MESFFGFELVVSAHAVQLMLDEGELHFLGSVSLSHSVAYLNDRKKMVDKLKDESL